MEVRPGPSQLGETGSQAASKALWDAWPAIVADDRLLVRGVPALRRVASAVVVTGAACLVADAWLVAQGMPNWFGDSSVTVAQLGLVLAGTGAFAWAAGWMFPRGRRPAVHVDAEEIPLRANRVLSAAGWLALLVGAAFLHLAAPTAHVGLTAGGAAAVFAGTAAVAAAAARGRTLRLLVAHRHALSVADRPLDPRTHEVIMALDALLGRLPDEDVRAFLATPQAPLYLQLLAEARAAAEAEWASAAAEPQEASGSPENGFEASFHATEEEAPAPASPAPVEARVAEGGLSHV